MSHNGLDNNNNSYYYYYYYYYYAMNNVYDDVIYGTAIYQTG